MGMKAIGESLVLAHTRAMALTPCEACARHIRSSEGDCPFCGARTSEPPDPRRTELGRVSRAMLVFGSVAALAGAAEACAPNDPASPPPVLAPVAMYGAPPETDASDPPPSPSSKPSAAISGPAMPFASTARPDSSPPGAVVTLYGGAPPPADSPAIPGSQGPKPPSPKKAPPKKP